MPFGGECDRSGQGREPEMLVIRDETPRDVGQARMINIAAFDQLDETFMVRVL